MEASTANIVERLLIVTLNQLEHISQCSKQLEVHVYVIQCVQVAVPQFHTPDLDFQHDFKSEIFSKVRRTTITCMYIEFVFKNIIYEIPNKRALICKVHNARGPKFKDD